MDKETSDYKNTLNLPQTDFPMRGNLPNREPQILEFWQKNDIYNQLIKRNSDKPLFILHDGPPYANGAIHVGHAMNKILKDMIIKSKLLQGFNAPYVPGWDCHGLPIEQKVEQKVGKANQKVSVKEFRDHCRAFAKEQVELQKPEFIRLGVLGDWENPYLTMNYQTEANIVRSLIGVVKKGHIKQGFKPINWCFDCGSSLAEAEVEYHEKQSFSIDVAFAVSDLSDLSNRIGVKVDQADVVIWTTTPWTLPSNVAVAVHADFEYGLYQTSKGKLIVAVELVEAIKNRWQENDDWQELARFNGRKIDKLALKHPFANRDVLVINGDHVTLEAGTGCVHTAPSHGVEDYDVCQKYGIEMINVLGGNGVFSEQADLVANQSLKNAENIILDRLKEDNRLIFITKFNHSYPHCWRHKTPTVYRATGQWFIAMDQKDKQKSLRNIALNALESVSFTPDWGKARLVNMIANRPDWCISRQRYWGVPLCFVVHKETGELHPDILSIMEKAADKIEQSGIEAWFELDLAELIAEKDLPFYHKLNDVLDVWFDSGTTHFSVLKQNPNLSHPADLYLEGSDQHRGWFHSSLLTGSAIDEASPYKALLTHGFTVDEQGRKMSKSLGNVVDPKKVINQMGADVLRLWVASVDYSAEVRLSQNILNQRADAYRRIRNTCRFLLANLHDFDPDKNLIDKENMLALDQYAIVNANNIQKKIISAYQNYQFHDIYQILFNYCTVDLGGFYLDVIKDRQYTVAKNNLARRSAQTAIYHILEAMVRWLSPICSFTAEEIWQAMPKNRELSVFFGEFYDQLFDQLDNFDEDFWQKMIMVRDQVNHNLEIARKENLIGSSLEVEIVINAPSEIFDLLSKLGDELRFLLLVSKVGLIRSENNKLIIQINKSNNQKCNRCWHLSESVGQNHHHPDLCSRCIENIGEIGEKRIYV